MLFLLIALGVFTVDFALKKYVESNIESGQKKEMANGKISVKKVHNHGFSLGIGKENPDRVRSISGLLSLFLGIRLVFRILRKDRPLRKLGSALMFGGAFSNWYDRFHQGYVTDYIHINNAEEIRPDMYPDGDSSGKKACPCKKWIAKINETKAGGRFLRPVCQLKKRAGRKVHKLGAGDLYFNLADVFLIAGYIAEVIGSLRKKR